MSIFETLRIAEENAERLREQARIDAERLIETARRDVEAETARLQAETDAAIVQVETRAARQAIIDSERIVAEGVARDKETSVLAKKRKAAAVAVVMKKVTGA